MQKALWKTHLNPEFYRQSPRCSYAQGTANRSMTSLHRKRGGRSSPVWGSLSTMKLIHRRLRWSNVLADHTPASSNNTKSHAPHSLITKETLTYHYLRQVSEMIHKKMHVVWNINTGSRGMLSCRIAKQVYNTQLLFRRQATSLKTIMTSLPS